MTEDIGKISSDGERFVSHQATFLKPSEFPPPKGATILLLTKYGKIVIGKWSDEDCSQWLPLPRKAT